MNKPISIEDYRVLLLDLRSKCQCEGLLKIYSARELYQMYENKCNFLGQNVALENADKSDEKFLRDYLSAIEKMERMGHEYQTLLQQGVINGNLILLKHVLSQGRPAYSRISIADLENQPQDRIITLNCSNCSSLVDLLG